VIEGARVKAPDGLREMPPVDPPDVHVCPHTNPHIRVRANTRQAHLGLPAFLDLCLLPSPSLSLSSLSLSCSLTLSIALVLFRSLSSALFHAHAFSLVLPRSFSLFLALSCSLSLALPLPLSLALALFRSLLCAQNRGRCAWAARADVWKGSHGPRAHWHARRGRPCGAQWHRSRDCRAFSQVKSVPAYRFAITAREWDFGEKACLLIKVRAGSRGEEVLSR
jgi:hypothetical protein